MFIFPGTTICPTKCIQLLPMGCFLFSLKKIRRPGIFIQRAQSPTKSYYFCFRSLEYFRLQISASLAAVLKKREQLLISVMFNGVMVKETPCAVSLDVFQPQTFFQFSEVERIKSQDHKQWGLASTHNNHSSSRNRDQAVKKSSGCEGCVFIFHFKECLWYIFHISFLVTSTPTHPPFLLSSFLVCEDMLF